MSERILTDSRGQRWDVVEEGGQLIFRHQSGEELKGSADEPLNGLSTEALLQALDRARDQAGLRPVGHGELDVAFDEEGYETGRP